MLNDNPSNIGSGINDKYQASAEESSFGGNGVQGIFRGRIENNSDPRKMGRVRVRIPSLTGGPGGVNTLGTNDCPWASPCFPFGAGEDFGSYVVPPVGTWVWCMCEDGDKNKIVYIGSIYGDAPKAGKTMGSMCKETEDVSMGQWQTTAGQNESPLDLWEDHSTNYPERGVVFKSPKGHTIWFSDEDDKESFTICDRIGQVIRFDCPVSAGLNKGNKYRRQTRLAVKDNQRSQSTGNSEHITIQSGLNDKDPERTFVKVYRHTVHLKCHNTKSNYYTEALFVPERIRVTSTCPGHMSRRTMEPTFIKDECGTSFMLMTENHITLQADRIDENP